MIRVIHGWPIPLFAHRHALSFEAPLFRRLPSSHLASAHPQRRADKLVPSAGGRHVGEWRGSGRCI